MTQEELKKIIENHGHWIKKDCEGCENMRADLSDADLSYANLYGADLRGADLYGADLSYANLRGADLSYANLRDADLYGADLRDANLCDANLFNANLSYANLRDADLSYANLRDANLSYANLRGADFDEKEKPRLGQILKEPITGYKKTAEGVIITAVIPKGAIVFSINNGKCRTNKARIIDMGGQHEVLHSRHDERFEYRLMQDIEIEDFNLMYNVECAPGFHFFKTKEKAEKY